MSSLFRDVFAGLARPNAETRMVHNDSFGNLPFVGGEEEAHDHWYDKWIVRRRTSMEEQTRTRDAAAVVFGARDVKRPVAARGDPGTFRPGERDAATRREDIYGGNFWG